ncbi:MAG: hypothetical protein EBS53_12580 [Bacteroidetes bacterium]|nr:hypothetical protein [Bacteroidota bacterium]
MAHFDTLLRKFLFRLGWLSAVCIPALLNGQAPQKMTYQSVVRSGSGALVSNRSIGLKISILQGSTSGPVIYSEVFTPNPVTNLHGLLSVDLGDGQALTGSLAGIDWGAGPYWVRTEVDLAGGNNYSVLGHSPLQSVPFALYAEQFRYLGKGTAPGNTPYWNGLEWVAGSRNLYHNGTNVGIGSVAPANTKLYVFGDSVAVSAYSTRQNAAFLQNNSDNYATLYAENFGNAPAAIFTADSFANSTLYAYAPYSNAILGYSTGTYATIAATNPNGPAGYLYGNSLYSTLLCGNDSGTAVHVVGGRPNLAAAYFQPSVGANGWYNASSAVNLGNLSVGGTLSKAAGTFRIDHPLDPDNKFLVHSFVESPDMMNLYNGNVITDAKGLATVELPSYFCAENKDFRYQLTAIGGEGFSRVRVVSKISDNRFVIQSDPPLTEVSWQVTGIRNDRYARAHPIDPEPAKAAHEKGRYLHPELYGQPVDQGLLYMDPPSQSPAPSLEKTLNRNE